ncbi:uncharacterized protein EDB91DRAFT_1107862 [Suillus paluster]|uniref:uncharacterized protein n=1 Tax=Suillus paluster TaxID=48578 RepID=UPI001B86C0D5|nr:uncharacterized protein EDB91DRAFT_1107862 [Suillus paluster]KAG1750520.1 hypothetical protein EDB91DRAFT_1107862 [Suillus paluster]
MSSKQQQRGGMRNAWFVLGNMRGGSRVIALILVVGRRLAFYVPEYVLGEVLRSSIRMVEPAGFQAESTGKTLFIIAYWSRKVLATDRGSQTCWET